MKTAGIIAEYNPFHNGHAYHIAKTKELTGADYLIAVISGDFVQRGMPALLDKYLRCETALSQGADLVLELPAAYAAASAEFFAMGTISLLDKLGAADSVCFGSECGDLHILSYLAGRLKEESPAFQEAIQRELKAGFPYPAARERAIESCHQIPGALSPAEELTCDEINSLVKEPNNILAIEYLKSLKRRNSSLTPYTIKRKGADYHDTAANAAFPSASAIRSLYQTGREPNLTEIMPDTVLSLLKREYQKRFPIFPNDFSLCLYYRLLLEKSRNTSLPLYQDVSRELGQRIYNELPSFQNYEDYAKHIKTRQYTQTRINRSLLHILLDIRAKDYQYYSQHDFIPYARVLGFRKSSSALLSHIKKNASIPLITKLADADRILDTCGKKMLRQDIFAADLYRRVQEEKFKTTLGNEYTEGLHILP